MNEDVDKDDVWLCQTADRFGQSIELVLQNVRNNIYFSAIDFLAAIRNVLINLPDTVELADRNYALQHLIVRWCRSSSCNVVECRRQSVRNKIFKINNYLITII